MKTRRITAFLAAMVMLVLATVVRAADPSGRWTASFTTEVGEQQYTFEFRVKGSTLTGTAKSNLLGDSELQEGKVDGDKISFVENANFQGMPLKITYSGTMTSADEIAFTRNVADIANEKLVAKRAK
jgi:hypothetical protein